jgi:GGDEF domain-containing protein
MQAASFPSPKAQSGVTDDAQEMLDGLPIPAAEIGRADGAAAVILRANDSFRSLARFDERLRGALIADVPLLTERRIGEAIKRTLDGDDGVHQFETSFGGRFLLVRLARLSGVGATPNRCLLTLIDQSVQVEVERGFSPELLRDALTGLPNRLAFEQRVAEVLEHPNFVDGTHALLTIRLAGPEEVAEELVAAAARRLLSALRAGDLLARTGPRSFAVLMRLERGQPGAVELTHRLQSVLAAPFRLSTCEIAAESAVESAPLRTPE